MPTPSTRRTVPLLALALAAALVAAACGSSGPSCHTVDDCSSTAAVTCTAAACVGGACTSVPLAAGTLPNDPTAGDCHASQCDGAGHMVSVADDNDLPVEANPCLQALCSAGVPLHPPRDAGTACSASGGIVCDGGGACVACNAPADCASRVCSDHACLAPICSDAVKNGAETGIDCGGTDCMPCGPGGGCLLARDCAAGLVCSGATCQVP